MLKTYKDEFDLVNKSILITGGTGSFGSSLVTYLLRYHNPKKIIIYSRDEDKQYHLHNTLTNKFPDEKTNKLRYLIGDVRELGRLSMATRDVDVVVHAAAMKHVTAAEYNPFECVKTNINGAENVVQAALSAGVSRVIALSTDKAVNPVNLYGATKLAADKIFVAANHMSGDLPTKFSNVRYGNVIGSRGSVIPHFQKLITEGATELPITSGDMTRFWISIKQGISFVLSCLTIMEGGETFVPKIPSMKITDVANAMAPQLSQKIIGLRPGEKLHETMIAADDSQYTMDFDDRFVILPSIKFYDRGYDYLQSAKALKKYSTYTSDGNSDWLTKAQFKELLQTHLPEA